MVLISEMIQFRERPCYHLAETCEDVMKHGDLLIIRWSRLKLLQWSQFLICLFHLSYSLYSNPPDGVAERPV